MHESTLFSTTPHDEWSLHPLLISQIKSIRPETRDRLYLDWFSRPSNQVCRFTPTAPYSAWDFVWAGAFFSWFCPPTRFLPAVCVKF
jgi:hypothetical protein